MHYWPLILVGFTLGVMAHGAVGNFAPRERRAPGVVRLRRAVCCVDCEAIHEHPTQCPVCGGASQVGLGALIPPADLAANRYRTLEDPA